MGLVLPSRRRELLAVAVVVVLGLAACLLAAGSKADARPAHNVGTVVPDGAYGVNVAARGEYILFTVQNRRVRKLAFQTQILCRTSDSPGEEPRFFSADHAPQGQLIPRNGRLHLEWQERGDGRLGNIGLTLRFGTRDTADLSITVPEEQGPEAMPDEAKETCDGGSILHFLRGYEAPVLPTTPSGAPAF
jgi:hypothetical protein